MAMSRVHNLATIIGNNGFGVGKVNMEDDDSHLNNSMVDDLVAKILDDDSIIGGNNFTPSYNTNSLQRQMENPYLDQNGFGLELNLGEAMNLGKHCSHRKLTNQRFPEETEFNYSNSYNEPKTSSMEQLSHPPGRGMNNFQQYAIQPDFLVPTNEVNYIKHQNNWSGPLTNHYRRIKASNPDLNFNVSSSPIMDPQELEYQTTQGQNTVSLVNPYPSYRVSCNNRNYNHNSPINDFHMDLGYSANPPLCYSSVEKQQHQGYANNIQPNGYEECKTFNTIVPGENIYFVQPQTQGFKLDVPIEQNYKPLICTGMNELSISTNQNLDTNENICFHANQNFGSTNKNSNEKNIDNKLYTPVGFPKDLEQSINKFDYYNYQPYTVNNCESSKMLGQNSTSYYPDLIPQTPNPYKKEVYERNTETAVYTCNQLMTSMENDIFQHAIKHNHLSNLRSIPKTDVIFNSSVMQQHSTAIRSRIYQPVMPMSVPLPLSPLYTNFYGNGLGIKSNNGPTRRTGPSSMLHHRLEQTYDQFKQLEKERKKCEAGLAAHFPGKKVTSANNILIPRLQGNPSRVDRLIIDYLREHARVITLITKMERLRGTPMNQRVHKAMDYWLEAIKFVQECRKQEIANATKRQKENPQCIPVYIENDISILANSVHKLTKACRYARTGMYNAMQATLLYNVDLEKTVIETDTDPILALSKLDEEESIAGNPSYEDCK